MRHPLKCHLLIIWVLGLKITIGRGAQGLQPGSHTSPQSSNFILFDSVCVRLPHISPQHEYLCRGD